MRIVFMGTPEFAVPSLERIHELGHNVVAVATAPDKPRGRGLKLRASAVKHCAEALGIQTILQPKSVKDPAFADQVKALNADVIVVVAFRILPPDVFNAARLGSFNVHGSLLPRYRGAAPIHHAVLNGDAETGVTTFFLQEKVDTGNVILRKSMVIGENDTTGDVYERMMLLGADAVQETLDLLESGDVSAEDQDNSLATPAPKVHSADAAIDWDRDAALVHNHIRGYSPIPCAWTFFRESRLKVFRSRLAANTDAVDCQPGLIHVAEDRLFVCCRNEMIEIEELQLEGRKRAGASDFINGYRVLPGERLGPLEELGNGTRYR